MNTITKSRLLSAVVILLLLANIATLATFWWTKVKAPLPQQANGRAADFLIKELAFDVKQQAAYRQLINEEHEQTRGVKEALRASKDAFVELFKSDSINANQVQQVTAEAGKQQQLLDIAVIEHFRKVRVLCTDDQKKKFDTIIQQVLRMMVGPQGPPPNRNGAGGLPPNRNGNDGPPPGMQDGQPTPRDGDGVQPPPHQP